MSQRAWWALLIVVLVVGFAVWLLAQAGSREPSRPGTAPSTTLEPRTSPQPERAISPQQEQGPQGAPQSPTGVAP